jgi:hypothetical protein
MRNDIRMRSIGAILLAWAFWPAGAWAQDAFKIEALKEAPPASLSAAIKAELNGQGYRVSDAQGKPVADFWLRKAVPASGKPAGPKGPVCFPVLTEGTLLGAVRFPAEGHDFRGQPIAAGVYTSRYGLQPVNGDHLGVSIFRDYALLVAAAKDTSIDALPPKKLQDLSAEAVGTSHPAVFMLLPPPPDAKATTMVHDGERDTWGAVVPLPLAIQGDSSPGTLLVQLVVAGMAQ